MGSNTVHRRGILTRARSVSLIGLAVLTATAAALPAGAQSVQEMVQRNGALVNQNKALMEQNRLLMKMIKKNASRIEKLETTVTRGSAVTAGVTGAAAPATGGIKLEQRLEKLETKQAALDKRSGATVKSGNKNVRLNISGQINRGVMIVDDGDNTDVLNVDNDNSSSRFRFVGEADMGNVTAGTNFEVEFESNSTADVNQNSESSSPTLKERKIEFYVGHTDYGKVSVGQGSTASDGTSEMDLSGTSVIGYSSITDMSGGILFFDNNTAALSTTAIKSVSSNYDGLGRDDRLRYDSPEFYGFSVAASTVTNDKWDVGLSHSGKYGSLQIVSGFGYSEPKGNIEYRINGSVSILHESGFNLTLAHGQDSLADIDRDPWSAYAKVGYLIDWAKQDVPWMARVGKTALAIDYQRTEDQAVKDDEFQSVGVFAVQSVDQLGAEFYAGVRWHDLDRDGSDFDSVMSTLVGARIKF